MNMHLRNRTIFSISSGVLLLWASLFSSYRQLPLTSDINKSIATGGFPFKAFDYPLPPMGSDWPPSGSWYPFFLNLLIWVGVGFLFSVLLQKGIDNKKLVIILPVLATITTIFGLLYIMWMFD